MKRIFLNTNSLNWPEFLNSKVGYVEALRPDGLTSPVALDFSGDLHAKAVKDRDVLFGYVLVQCPECTVHVYWVTLIFPRAGSYRAGRWNEYDWYHLTRQEATNAASKLLQGKDSERIRAALP